ncbi:fibronectin type III domain-containing protein 7-like [Spinachia spinachia]
MSTAQVMWGAARGASWYSVQAVNDQSSVVTCDSTNTSCSLNGLQCSHIYNVSVTARNLGCDSTIAETLRLMTEPCPPTNVQARMSCELLSATVSWQQSDLAVGYVAYFDNQEDSNTSCVGSDGDTQCVVSGLMCGTVYHVWVKVLGWQNTSSDSAVTTLTSVPCPTSSIKATTDCESQSASVSWQPSAGALSYVSELSALSGATISCATNQTKCDLSSLQCGEEYNITVKALGDSCNSTAQMAGHLTTGPCVPTNVSVHYNASTAQVMWGAARGASSYWVNAVTDQGSMVSCNSTNTRCSLNGLQCSRVYNVTVMVRDLDCNSTVTSEPSPLMTEPCPPTEVKASVACEQLAATVSWQHSDLALDYVAYLGDQSGTFASCVGSGAHTYCVVSGLMCGAVYRVWVKALGRQYNSSDSTVISLTSAPCLPSEVEVEADCNSDGAAAVSWNATYGVANFSLSAAVGGGLRTLCATQQNSCHVTGLTCGETYSLSLSAMNKQCNLTAPTRANLTTRPCPPRLVAVDLQCGNRAAVLSWLVTSDVELYEARAVKTSGGGVRTCNSTGAACRIAGLECGEVYNFTVKAHGAGRCSQAGSIVVIQTEPCQPVIVSAQAACQSELVQISWHQSSGVVNYFVTASGSLGYVEVYNTTQTLLTAVLPCGQEYNVTDALLQAQT